MKKILFLIPFLGLLSCEEALVEQPKAVAVETFYNTASEVEAAVNAAYGSLRAINGITGQLGAQLESYTDYSYGRGSYAILSDFQGLNSTNIPRTDEGWRLFYLAIRNANLVIQNAPKGSSISQSDVAKYVAEAKYLRAYSYFWLVRNWGGVPIRTEAQLNEPNIGRSSAEAVYTLILADLNEAEANLPDKGAQVGRVTKWVAKAALAEVFFTRNQYAEARDKADEIIKSGKFSLVPVATAADFDAKIFGPTIVNTTEEVWYLKETRQPNQGMYLAMYAHHPGSKLHGAGGFYTHYSDLQTNLFMKNWDDKDLRKSGFWYNWDIGLGKNSILCKKFSDPLAATSTSAGNDFPIYRYSDILLMYAEAASRAGNGPTAAALEALNQVHRRAYGKTPTTVSDVDFKLTDFTATTFNDLVLKERGYETQYEAKRWLDLKRLGTSRLKEIIKAATGKTVADKHLLWPIPVSELSYNTAITVADQNPGY